LWHPDRNTHTAELARRKFDEAKIALDILTDETIRRQYDLKKFTSVLDLLKNRPQATRAGY
jgi:DnaJ-class molecular chaperone